MPLQKWFFAIYLCVSLKKGISSNQLSKFIGVTQKTAWLMLQRIRLVFETGSFEKLTDEVEMDEAYIGSKDSNKHASTHLKAIIGKGAKVLAAKTVRPQWLA